VSKHFLRALLVWSAPGWLMFGFSGVMAAAPLTWSLLIPTGFEGSFAYDADTGVVSQWSIITLPSMPPPPPPPLFYGPHDPTCFGPPLVHCVSDSISAATDTAITFVHVDDLYSNPFILYLVFSAPLSDSGGTIPLVPAGPPGPPNGEPISGTRFESGGDTAGIYSGTVSAVGVPEPGTTLYMALLIAPLVSGHLWARCRRASKSPLPRFCR
jgi:hypothetical protein